MGRIVASILALILGANGLTMLFAGLWWYAAAPGVTATGPYNPHFVRDVGAAYLVVGASLAAFAARPRDAWPAVTASAAFLALHAAIHVFDAACGTKPFTEVRRDFVGVYLPALIVFVLALRKPPMANFA